MNPRADRPRLPALPEGYRLHPSWFDGMAANARILADPASEPRHRAHALTQLDALHVWRLFLIEELEIVSAAFASLAAEGGTRPN
jgi:hypothetical protein